jgi:hypothetical protein
MPCPKRKTLISFKAPAFASESAQNESLNATYTSDELVVFLPGSRPTFSQLFIDPSAT